MVDRWLTTKQIAEMLGFPNAKAMILKRHRGTLSLPLDKRDGRLGQRMSIVQNYIKGEPHENS